MTSVILSPWKGGTPRRLARALEFKLLNPREVPIRKPVNIRFLLNWGCINLGGANSRYPLNYPEFVRIASNKLSTFRKLIEYKIPTLEFTESDEQAAAWNKNHSIIGHHDLHGHSGEGLTLFKRGAGISAEEASKVEVYTKYFPKKKEVRVHVIKVGPDTYKHLYLEKKRVLPPRYEEFGLDGSPDTYIRTHSNGWIYAREVDVDQDVVDLACDALKTLGLHYGAVDILVKDKEARVGEVNTAPGLKGQALDFYVENLKLLFGMYNRAH